MSGRSACLGLTLVASMASLVLAQGRTDDGGGFPQDPLAAPARRVPAPAPAKKGQRHATAKTRPKASTKAQAARARVDAENANLIRANAGLANGGLEFVAPPVNPVVGGLNGAIGQAGMVVPGNFYGNFNSFGGNTYTNGLVNFGVPGFGGFGGFGGSTFGGFGGSTFVGTGGNFYGGYGGGILPYYAATLGGPLVNSTGSGTTTSTTSSTAIPPVVTDRSLIHGYDGDSPDFAPSTGFSNGRSYGPRIETVQGGSRVDGYGVALRKGEVVYGGNYLPGYGVIGSSNDSQFGSYGYGVSVQGGNYMPGFGVMAPGFGATTGASTASAGYNTNASGVAVQGGNYVPGFGVMTSGFGSTNGASHFNSVSGSSVPGFGFQGGSYQPGFGVVRPFLSNPSAASGSGVVKH